MLIVKLTGKTEEGIFREENGKSQEKPGKVICYLLYGVPVFSN